MNARIAEQPVTIIMVEDDEGHARLIEKNIRRAGVNNPIRPFTNGSDAVKIPVRGGRNRDRQQRHCPAHPA